MTDIFIPNSGEARILLENAWEDFCQKITASGTPLSNLPPLAKDMFMAGYSYGWNEIFTIIRGQLKITNPILNK